MDDWQLLSEYVTRNSETAFRTLVDRYAGTVYHIALRQTGNPHIAEEATQTVFITLAQKAPKISKGVVLYGWLFRATRFAVMNLAREAARRRHHEQEALTMQTDSESNESDPIWEEISPLLNDALEALSQSDRDVLMIRYFGHKSHRDLGQMLGISEDTAKKRVSRAVEKLRAIFAKRGVAVTSIALAAAFSAHAAQAAPAGLAASVATAAIGKGVSGAATTTAASKGVANLMTLAKLKLAAMIGGAVVIAAGTTAVIVDQSAKQNQSTNAVQGQFIAGQVLQPDGKPAAGVTIFYFHSKDEYVALNAEGRPSRMGRNLEQGPAPGGYFTDLKQDSDNFISHPDAKTDADGRFSIPVGTAPDRGRNLVMLGDEGYALVPVSSLGSDPVTLKPWAKITGRLMIGDRPGANQMVKVGLEQPSAGYRAGSSPQLLQHRRFWDETTMQWDAKTKTDSNGNFEFARIMPGDLLLGRYIELPAPGPKGWWNGDPPEVATGLTQTMPVSVKGGETISVQLGGHGRTIIGRITKGDVGIAKWDEQIYYLTKTVALPPGYDYWTTNDDETARFRKWFETPEGRAAIAGKRQYIMEFNRDGSFKIQDVQPGEYDFRVAVHKSFKTGGAGQDLAVAEATNHFAVPAPPEGQSPDVTPMDVGTVQMEWIPGYIVYWLERGKLEPIEDHSQRVRGVDSDAIAALDEQLKARQSVTPTGKEITIDLSRYVNAKLTDPLGDEVYDKDNNLVELPSGIHVFGGMPFDIEGIVQLNSTSVDPYLRKLPQEVTGINIGHKFKKLHLLHAQIYGVMAAVQDATLILHYVDGTQAEIPIVCDVRVQNFNALYVPIGLPDLPENSELAWIGSNPFMKKYYPARALHLYRTVFDNPHPDVEVASIDFVSKMTPIAPFIAGLTLE